MGLFPHFYPWRQGVVLGGMEEEFCREKLPSDCFQREFF